jgi:hypothetical protein
MPLLDPESVSVTVKGSEPWGALRNALGPFTGRTFALRLWYPDQVLEDAYIALQGEIDAPGFAGPTTPNSLHLSLKRSEAALSVEMISSRLTIRTETWGSHDFDSRLEGQAYPIVIGHPGDGAGAASPALYVNNVDEQVMIAGHHVDASTVRIIDQSDAGTFYDLPVTNGLDDILNPVAMVDLTGSFAVIDKGKAFFASFSAANGGGVKDGNRVVSGLGDVLIWGSKNFSRAVFDLGQMEAQRLYLNRYQIDTVINQLGVTWEDWVQQNLIDLYNLEVVNGPRGIYYRQVRYDASAAEVVATLTTGARDGGIRVSRESEIVETTEDIYNQITVQFGAIGMSSSSYSRSSVVGPNRDASTGQIPDAICLRSFGVYGLRPKTIGTLTTWDQSTGDRLARDAVLRYAMPKPVTTYRGSTELFRLTKGSVVRVNDTVGGAAFSSALARVTDLAFGSSNTALATLLFTGDIG